jgi:hypothetical protein
LLLETGDSMWDARAVWIMLGSAPTPIHGAAIFRRLSMRVLRLVFALLVVSMVVTAPTSGANSVPFKGSWTGVTISADPTNFPVVAVVSAGTGQLTHLGNYEMISPHTSNVITGETIGDQIFTAANGDTLTAFCEGFPTFQPDGTVAGGLDCEITGGTGRFEGASGSYVFFLVASPLPDGSGFATEAEITGEISF